MFVPNDIFGSDQCICELDAELIYIHFKAISIIFKRSMQEIISHKVWTLKDFLTSNECQDFRNLIDNAASASDRSFSCSGEFYNSVFKDHAIADMFLGRLL